MLSLDRQNRWREIYRQSHPDWRPATEIFADRVRHYLHPDARLLDLGCGRGGLIEQLAHPLAHSVGIDPDIISLIEHRTGALPRLVGLSDRLPFRHQSFDVVIAGWLLEHLANPASTFYAVARILQPGGVFVFITPNARHPIAWGNRVIGRLGAVQGRLVSRIYGRADADTFPTAYRANTPASIARLAADSGLILDEILLVTDPTYLAFNKALYQTMSALDTHLPANRRIHIVGVVKRPD